MSKAKMYSFYITEELSKGIDMKILREGGDRSSVVREALTAYLMTDLALLSHVKEGLTTEQLAIKSAWETGVSIVNAGYGDNDVSAITLSVMKDHIAGNFSNEGEATEALIKLWGVSSDN